jgi:hypothetical protein
MNEFHVSQPETNKEINMTNTAAIKVTFSSTDAVITIEKDKLEARRLWYSKKETSSMRREYMVLSKHFNRLTQQQHYKKEDLIGLEDAKVTKERWSKRKLALQSILLEQAIHRALKLDDPTKIATIAEGYSKQACTQALQRAKNISPTLDDDSISSLVSEISAAEIIKNSSTASTKQLKPTETPPPDITFRRAPKAVAPNCYVDLKGELPQPANHKDLQRKELDDTLRFARLAASRVRRTSE